MILVGTGNIAFEYAKALKQIGERFTTMGNSDPGCERWAERLNVEQIPYKMIQSGGVSASAVLSQKDRQHAIVAIPINEQYETVKRLVALGVRNILVEKPAVLYSIQARALDYLARAAGVDVRVAYNRRFYCSSQMAKDVIKQDGLAGLRFCFGEDMHAVKASSHPDNVKRKWILANSSHVIDLAKWLCGGWHIAACHAPGVLSGSGTAAQQEAPVSYLTDYSRDTRWAIQFTTKTDNYYRLAPVERLEHMASDKWQTIVQEPAGSIKAGFLEQTQCFLDGKQDIPTITEQLELIQDIDKIGGFKE